MEKIKIGISSCLLGNKVRYDGGHKLDRFLRDTLGRYVEYVPVCPEVEFGLPVPRESMHLEGDPDSPRLVTTVTRQDMTNKMVQWAKRRVVELEKEGLWGFIFKSDSPSNGMQRVKVYNEKGMNVKKGIGIFAKIFMEHFPLLPVEDDERLHDPGLRENFIERIFTLKRWQEVLSKKPEIKSLVKFHSQHKFLILSHSPRHARSMEKLVARIRQGSIREIILQYQKLLMEALKLQATPKKNANVLMHIMGYFKKELSPEEEKELLEVIETYRKEFIPLIVPITLIKHYARKYNQSYLKDQIYLNPHPIELQLRNHV